MYIFFFSSRRRHTRWPRDWSSDVCSSDLFKIIPHHDFSFCSVKIFMYLCELKPFFLSYLQALPPYPNPLPSLQITLDRKSTRLNSSHVAISYAVFCLKKKKKQTNNHTRST